MTIDEFMRDIAPKMRPSWVAMDKNNKWFWYNTKPKIDKIHKIWFGADFWGCLDCFDISPVDDWTQSLRKVGFND